MMTKTCFLLCALLVLAAIVCSPVLAARYQSQLDPGKWQDIDGICTYDRDATWSYRSNGLDVEELIGCEPPVGSDPRVRQYVVNNTIDDIWTDWHVEIVNGSNLRDIFVYDALEGTPWVIEPYTDKLGFFAHVVSAGPGNPMAIDVGETLYVEFSYDAIPGPVTINQYPTTWYPVPEPASIMALLAGIGAFGLGAIRRIKR
jgi:hypothetical protein